YFRVENTVSLLRPALIGRESFTAADRRDTPSNVSTTRCPAWITDLVLFFFFLFLPREPGLGDADSIASIAFGIRCILEPGIWSAWPARHILVGGQLSD